MFKYEDRTKMFSDSQVSKIYFPCASSQCAPLKQESKLGNKKT